MSNSAATFSNSPQSYPHTWDELNDALYVVKLTQADYLKASFLDQRVVTPATQGAWFSYRDGANSAALIGLSKSCHFIFHIGHVGSTLLSRLLGDHPQVFSLREPTPLRTLARLHHDLMTPESVLSPAAFAERLSLFVKLWGRTWTADQISLVKATSLACALAQTLLAQAYAPRAIMMFVAPETFLASILAAPNSPQDIRAMAKDRLSRLHRLLGRPAWRLWEMSLGELIAMSWACEMTALRVAASGRSDSVHWIEFDQFLAQPQDGLSQSFGHLGIEVTPKTIDKTVTGPLMSHYSKAPEHAYDAALRRDVLQEGRALRGEDIRRGIRWLDQAGKDFPVIAEALAFASV